MTVHIDSQRRKELVSQRYIPIIKQILTWPDKKYSEAKLFQSILTELTASKDQFYDQIDSAILEFGGSKNEHQELKQDISDNYSEYKSILFLLIGYEINNKYPKFI